MKTILLLTDFSEKSEQAAEFAYQVAANANANLIFFNTYFIPQGSVFAGMYSTEFADYSDFQDESMNKLRVLAEKVKHKYSYLELPQVPIIHCENEIGNLSENVKEFLEKREIWMIIMGSKRTDGILNHFIVGSDTKMVIETANCPVLLISEKTEFKDLKKIAFASAGFDEEDFKALNFIADLANPSNAEIIITHISTKNKKEKVNLEIPREIYISWSEMKYKNVSFHDIKSDEVSESIKKFSLIENVDMITLIYRKHTFFELLFSESTIRKMLKFDVVPLLIFPKNYFE